MWNLAKASAICSMPLTTLLTFTLMVNLCSADPNVLADAIKQTVDAQGDFHKASSAHTSRRQLLKADSEEIVITQGYYEADILNSDNITIAFEVGSGIGGDVHCEILFHGGVVLREMSPCHSPIELEGTLKEDGAYGFIATGKVKRTSEPVRAVSTWGLDREPPETMLEKVKGTNDTKLKFSFTGDDQYGVAGYECNFDHTKWIPCTSPQTVKIDTAGQYCFEVRAVDYGGNVDVSPIHYEWVTQTGDSDSSTLSLESAEEHDDHDHEHDEDHDQESSNEHSHSHSHSRVAVYIIIAVISSTFFFVLAGVLAALRHGRTRSKLQYISDCPPPKVTKKLSQHPVIYESGSDLSQIE